MKIRLLIAMMAALAALVPIAGAQTVPGKFSYPAVGTVLETNQDEIRIEAVNGFDATVLAKRANRNIGLHAHFITGSTVGNTLRYDRAAVEALWPLELGKTVSFDANREGGVWSNTLTVLRTETVTVPAGTFFAYVVEDRERGVVGSNYRSITLRWFAPELGFTVKFHRTVEHTGQIVEWQLLKVTKPSG